MKLRLLYEGFKLSRSSDDVYRRRMLLTVLGRDIKEIMEHNYSEITVGSLQKLFNGVNIVEVLDEIPIDVDGEQEELNELKSQINIINSQLADYDLGSDLDPNRELCDTIKNFGITLFDYIRTHTWP